MCAGQKLCILRIVGICVALIAATGENPEPVQKRGQDCFVRFGSFGGSNVALERKIEQAFGVF